MDNKPHVNVGTIPTHSTKNNLQLHLEHVSAVWALEKLIALHEREAEGDETITMKEWNAAISAGKAVLNNAIN